MKVDGVFVYLIHCMLEYEILAGKSGGDFTIGQLLVRIKIMREMENQRTSLLAKKIAIAQSGDQKMWNLL